MIHDITCRLSPTSRRTLHPQKLIYSETGLFVFALFHQVVIEPIHNVYILNIYCFFVKKLDNYKFNSLTLRYIYHDAFDLSHLIYYICAICKSYHQLKEYYICINSMLWLIFKSTFKIYCGKYFYGTSLESVSVPSLQFIVRRQVVVTMWSVNWSSNIVYRINKIPH